MIKIDKLFGDKKGNGLIYILLAVGIILLMAGNSVKKAPAPSPVTTQSARAAEAERILSEIKGAGQVRVMISEEEKTSVGFSSEKDSEKSGCSVLIVADGGADSAHLLQDFGH